MKLLKKIWIYIKAFILVWGKMYRATFNSEKNKSDVEKTKKRLDKAIAEADEKHTLTGKRYYVLPYDSKDLKFVALNRDQIKLAQKRKIIKRNLNIYEVLNMARYVTK